MQEDYTSLARKRANFSQLLVETYNLNYSEEATVDLKPTNFLSFFSTKPHVKHFSLMRQSL
jgi:hypothetical protein